MNRKKFTVVYVVMMVVVMIFEWFYLKSRKEKLYSRERYESLITAQGKWRDKTEDLCQYYIHGDPKAAGKEIVRVNIWCSADKKVANNLWYEALPGREFGQVIAEYARIVGFDPQILLEKNSMWKCYVNRVLVTDIKQRLENMSEIDCLAFGLNLKQLKPKTK